MNSVHNNLAAFNADRQLKISVKRNQTSVERLSSGYRINRSADDAAGLTISEKMRSQIRGLTQASANAQDGVSLVQIAEGALNEVHDMLHRSGELAVKAANGTLTDSDREAIDAEIQQIKDEIDGIAQRTIFNELQLFPQNGKSPKSAQIAETYHYELEFDLAGGAARVGSAAAGRAAGAISTGSELADRIANEFIPNAVSQILDSFPSLKNAAGNNTINMALDVSYLDGPNNTLAYAQYTYKINGGPPVSMLIKVDAADFDDADAQGTGSRAEELESTIAHELMHSVMQYTMTDGMSGRKGDAFPGWFVEGTAQLAGGGFPTGWNNSLAGYAGKLADAADTSQDANIAKYLKSYSMSGRPYGHGYLGAAYLGYLANGGGAVTGPGIAAGMDKIFQDILDGKSFADAIKNQTGLSESDLNRLFANGDQDLVDFVRELSYESLGGAGSVITSALSVGGTDILGDTAGVQPFRIDPSKVHVDTESGGARVDLQIGAQAEHFMQVDLYQIDAISLGLQYLNVKTIQSSRDAIEMVEDAVGYVSGIRSYYGAVQNRLEHTITNLDNVVENTTAAESRIRDTDMAGEAMRNALDQILLQAGQSMLANANRQPESMLGLLA